MKSRRLFVAIALVVLGFSGTVGAAQQDDLVAPEVRQALASTGQAGVIVAFHDPVAIGADNATRRAAVAQLQDDLLANLPGFTLTYRYMYIPALAGTIASAHLAALEAKPYIARVEFNIPLQATLNDVRQLINADAGYALGYTGAGIRVAVLDSGVDTDHPDLQDSIMAQQCYNSAPADCPPGNTPTGSSAEDENGHGTNVAGIITSNGTVAPRGVAPDAEIVAVRILNTWGGGSMADVIAGLDYVRGLGSVHLINLSLGGATTYPAACDAVVPALANAAHQLAAQGTVIIAASGNYASTGGVSIPACVSDIIPVGAVYDADVGSQNWGVCIDATTAADRVACFTNRGPNLALLAPGALTLAPGAGGGTSQMGGTSQAAPVVTAAAAALFQAGGVMSRGALAGLLHDTGVPIFDASTGLTFRRIDLYRALQQVLSWAGSAQPETVCRTAMAFRSADPAPFDGEIRFYTRFDYDPAFQVEGWLEDTLPVVAGVYTAGEVEVGCGLHVRAWLFDAHGAPAGLVPSQYENGDATFVPYTEDYGTGGDAVLNPVYAGRYADLFPAAKSDAPAALRGGEIIKTTMGDALEWGLVRDGVYRALGWSWTAGDGSVGCSVPEAGLLSLDEFCAWVGGAPAATGTGKSEPVNAAAAPQLGGEIMQHAVGDAIEWGLVQNGVYTTLGWSWDAGENLVGCSIPEAGPMTVEAFCAFVVRQQ
ncbi:MAG: S8 family serine peptidase [Anaerolineae bacterium]|nr:S8 family serine peptidase [Anaerolineae bacterium]